MSSLERSWSTAHPVRPIDVKNSLIERANRHLPYMAGNSYKDITVRCLESNIPGEQFSNSFRRLVVDELRMLAFPALDASRGIKDIDEADLVI